MQPYRLIRKSMSAMALSALAIATTLRPASAWADAERANPARAESPNVASTQQSAASDLQLLRNPDPSVSSDARAAAAVQLLLSQDPTLTTPLTDILSKGPAPSSQAVGRALTSSPWRIPQFLPALERMLNSDDAANVALAASILSQYHGDTRALDLLIPAATASRGAALRVPAIRALASFVQKRAAETLVELQQSDPSVAVLQASGDALTDMTGHDFGSDAAKWASWWAEAQTLNDSDFLERTNQSRTVAYGTSSDALERLRAATGKILDDAYLQATGTSRTATLLSYLHSSAPEIRALGADLVYDSTGDRLGAPPGTLEATRGLLRDPSPSVRAAAAHALTGNAEAEPALIQCLTLENDDVVRVRLIQALSPLADVRAVPVILRFVNSDAPLLVRISAVEAMAQAADAIDASSALHHRVELELRAALSSSELPGRQALREKVVMALSAMRDNGLVLQFYQLLNPQESPAVRQQALRALGKLPDPSMPAMAEIARHLDDDNAGMRLAAAQAMLSLPNPAPLYVDKLLTRLSQEKSREVSEACWAVLRQWATSPDMSESDLSDLAEGLKAIGPAKELFVRLQIVSRLTADAKSATGDDREQTLRNIAAQQETIGELMMTDAVAQPAQAADQFQTALTFWRANQGKPEVIDRLCGNLAHALLAAKNWEQAARFASSVVRDFAGQGQMRTTLETVGDAFLQTAEQVTAPANATSEAAALFAAVDRMDPPLQGEYSNKLRRIETQFFHAHPNLQH